MMKTLAEHYQKGNTLLESQLREADTIDEIVKSIQDEIRKLRDVDGEYMGNLTLSQAKIARQELAELYQSISLVTVFNPQNRALVLSRYPSQELVSQNRLQDMAIVAVISSAIAVSVGSFIRGWLGIGITGVLAGVLAAISFSLYQRRQQQNKPTAQQYQINKDDLEKAANAIWSYFQQKLENIDNKVAEQGGA